MKYKIGETDYSMWSQSDDDNVSPDVGEEEDDEEELNDEEGIEPEELNDEEGIEPEEQGE